MKQVCAVLGNEAAPEMLSVLPQNLDSVELWAVGRQIVQMQPMFSPLTPLFIHDGAFVYAGVIDQDDSRNVMRKHRDLFEECNNIVSCRRSLLSYPGQLAIVTQSPKHVHALPVRERLDGSGLADFSPAVLHRRIRAEA